MYMYSHVHVYVGLTCQISHKEAHDMHILHVIRKIKVKRILNFLYPTNNMKTSNYKKLKYMYICTVYMHMPCTSKYTCIYIIIIIVYCTCTLNRVLPTVVCSGN